ncbi:hypothetical protein ACIF70_05845 [Actinacidiphila glaucinigra]|uniref:SLOG cluster 4 domain-containing protein n=1 Tax=Actinacidiphila glaucinigra TaxID=235986 RepID=UPI0037C7C143
MTSRYVAVVGPAEATGREREDARRVGELLARRGAVVVCGGLGGVMGAASEGARAQGGTTVGLLPGRDRRAGDPSLTVAIATVTRRSPWRSPPASANSATASSSPPPTPWWRSAAAGAP